MYYIHTEYCIYNVHTFTCKERDTDLELMEQEGGKALKSYLSLESICLHLSSAWQYTYMYISTGLIA